MTYKWSDDYPTWMGQASPRETGPRERAIKAVGGEGYAARYPQKLDRKDSGVDIDENGNGYLGNFKVRGFYSIGRRDDRSGEQEQER